MELLVIPGDGIGPEVIAQACRVADWIAAKRRPALTIKQLQFGLEPWRRTGHLLPRDTLEAIMEGRAILFGAIGGDEYESMPLDIVRNEGLLRIRKQLDLFANLRPVRAWPMLAGICPVAASRAAGADLLIIRELAGGLYYGEPRGIAVAGNGARTAINTLFYDDAGIRRIARVAFQIARRRACAVMSVDKSNVLETGQLWRQEVTSAGAAYGDVALSHMLVDNCALQLIRNPSQFDVIVTGNMFGDILSDTAGAIAGSLGMLPSASLHFDADGPPLRGLYEPVHGSAPDIAGRDMANPIAAVLSLAMAFRFSFEDEDTALLIEKAVEHALGSGVRTADIMEDGMTQVGTCGMGDAIMAALDTVSP